jgi:hypothetical protein
MMCTISPRQLLPCISLTLLLITSCSRIKQKANESINITGKTIGQGTSEFVSGVSEGVDGTFECAVVLSKELTDKGIHFGKFKISANKEGAKNLFSVYLIFDKDFRDNIVIKVTDKKGEEYGRIRTLIEAKHGEAGYHDFEFDNRTDIESRSSFAFDLEK